MMKCWKKKTASQNVVPFSVTWYYSLIASKKLKIEKYQLTTFYTTLCNRTQTVFWKTKHGKKMKRAFLKRKRKVKNSNKWDKIVFCFHVKLIDVYNYRTCLVFSSSQVILLLADLTVGQRIKTKQCFIISVYDISGKKKNSSILIYKSIHDFHDFLSWHCQ